MPVSDPASKHTIEALKGGWSGKNVPTGPIHGQSMFSKSPIMYTGVSLVAQMVKNPPAMQETQVRSPGHEKPLEKVLATHSIILAWKIPQTEKPGGLQSMGLQNWIQLKQMSTTWSKTDRKTVVEIDGGDVCTTIRTYLILLMLLILLILRW